MHTLLHNTYRFFKRLMSIFWNVPTLLFVIAAAVGLGFYLHATQRAQSIFDADFATYTTAARAADDAAFVPGAPQNAVRQNINSLLTQVLAKQTSNAARLKFAQEGIQAVKDSQAQIDEITTVSAKVDDAIAKMQVDSVGTFSPNETARRVIALAKKRQSIISDIRAYSYRADFETELIFEELVKDNGALKDAYVTQLNNDTPDIETQFDKRSNLYSELQGMDAEIADAKNGVVNAYTDPGQ